MAKLPEIQQRGAVTRGPQSSVSAAEIANPYQQIANALSTTGQALQRQEVAEAQNEGQNAVYRDEAGNLKVDTRSNFSASGRSYNAAAQQGYAARLAGDIRARGAALTAESKGNIESFNSSWKAFRDQTLTAVPKDFRGAVTTMLDTEGPRFALGVSEQKRSTDIKEFEGNVKAEIQLLDDDMSALARGGGTGTDAYKQKQAQARTLYGQLAENPDFTVGKQEADIAVKRMESRHMSEAMLGTVDRALQTGGIGEARKIAERMATDTSLSLSPAERRQYAGLAGERINGFVAQTKANLKPVQDQSTVIQKRLKEGVGLDNDDIDTTARQLAAGGDMSGAMELYSARAMARTLQGFKSSDNRGQTNQAERLLSQANGGGDILAAIRQTESSGDPNAVSARGAAGSMQVMPETADEIAQELGDAGYPAAGTREEKQAYLKSGGVSDRYGEHYFNKMMTKYGGDREAALIAYNGGAKRADAWIAAGRDDSVIPKESADYYKKVLGSTVSASQFSAEDVTAAKTFLQTRTDKDASHIDGMDGAFSVKVARMLEAAPAGIREKLGIYSGARSVARQTELWEEAVIKYGSAAEARKWVAPPGNSQHNHGKAADLSYGGQSLKNAPPEVVSWLHQNAAQFGLKFPLANENWHIEDDTTRGGKGSNSVNPELVKEYRAEVTSDAKQLFTDIKAGYDKNLTPAVADINLLSRQLAVVDDQDLRREVADYFTSQSAIAQTAGMAPAQVESLVSSLRSDAADGATAAQAQIISGIEAQEKARTQALKDDPIGFAARQGMIAAPPPLDLSQPDTWAGTFTALQNGADVLKARGQVGTISALRPEMQAQVSRALTTSTPQDSVQLLSSMATNLSPDTYNATMAALYSSGQSRAAAAAGALVPNNPEAAEGVLRGQQLLKENPLLAPKRSDDNTVAINDILPPAVFAPTLEGARQGLLEAATARYADLSAQAGDTSGELNADRMEQSVKEITGGILEFNGSQIVAPRYGMSQDDFDKTVEAISDQDISAAMTSGGTAVRADDFRDQGRLRAVADGRYLLEFGSAESPSYALRRPSPGGYGQPSVFVLDLRVR
ncbi:transglycosylase SLT domain-containing protein [Ferranicluibacter rubi]|uniref:transglycosylase SLT domain-containing protein n=1 Tax=Ferranicluibacter rubi TaxID=2715133 RepID=UPI0031BB6DD9